ncbi:MAG TPA: DUF494 domain-containing protein [Rhodocyclaceae bacterium]|nr:DUF494 domain-containing protein [Zoogloeaceae bacterium]HRD33907.1 DUF494 domain-containing protein [Rhodocyclaceae bacterium]
MFDIFVYLFENYVHAGACPESDQLARKLSAAGFEDEDISEALEWLNGLRETASAASVVAAPSEDSIRVYAPEEEARIDTECRGFLLFLENAGVLEAPTRELIIERALALSSFNLNLHRLKVIVLMVLWQQDRALDTLILDELLADEDDEDYTAFQ